MGLAAAGTVNSVTHESVVFRHYTLPNGTDVTRVSIDFRVIPRSKYYAVRFQDGRPRFVVGAYYAAYDPQEVVELQTAAE